MPDQQIPLGKLYSMEKQPHHRNGHYDPDPDVEWACRLCPEEGATSSYTFAQRDAERHLVDEHNVATASGEATS